jgi:hypothetical protein
MKKLLLIAAASSLGLGVLTAPSSAQVRFDVGPGGPSVRVGPSHEERWERRRDFERRRFIRDDRMTTGSIAGCRTIIVREQNDFGDTVTKRIQRCR